MTENTVAGTPGPWRVGDAGHTIFGAPDPTRNTPDQVATLCRTRFSTRSNARLIAAAPELLDALRGMLEWARRVEQHTPGLEVAQAVTAIAKAEGRTP
jgi:hypothetical protein